MGSTINLVINLSGHRLMLFKAGEKTLKEYFDFLKQEVAQYIRFYNTNYNWERSSEDLIYHIEGSHVRTKFRSLLENKAKKYEALEDFDGNELINHLRGHILFLLQNWKNKKYESLDKLVYDDFKNLNGNLVERDKALADIDTYITKHYTIPETARLRYMNK